MAERTILHDPAHGALTQLYAGTSKEGAELNGKVRLLYCTSRIHLTAPQSI